MTDGFTVISSDHKFDGWAFKLRTDEVRMPDGSVAKRDVIDHLGAVAVVALDPAGQVAMVRQYRHPVGHRLLELPAGLLDVSGESALVAAQRELYEEAALTATDWSVLVDLWTSPGMTNEAIRVYLARELSPVPEADRFAAEHEEVSMTVEWVALTELAAMALRGELTNGPAVAGVLAADAARRTDWSQLRPVTAAWPGRPDRVPEAG